MSEIDDSWIYVYLDALRKSGYKLESRTILFGKPYVWMRAPDGTSVLERIPDTNA